MMKLTSGILERNISKTYSYNKYCDAIIMKALTDVAKLLKQGCFITNTHAERRHVQALRILILIIGAGPPMDDTELRLLLVRAGLRGIRPGLSDCLVRKLPRDVTTNYHSAPHVRQKRNLQKPGRGPDVNHKRR